MTDNKDIGPVDIKMYSAGKEKFKELYDLSEDERNKLRTTSAYRLSLLDLWEIAASCAGYSVSDDKFFSLFGKAVYGIMTEKHKIIG